MTKRQAISLLNAATLTLWAVLLLCIIISPSTIIKPQGAISSYVFLPETFWILVAGISFGGLLMTMFAQQINPRYKILKMSTFVVGISLMLLQVFRLGDGRTNETIHILLAGILFTSMLVGVMSTSRKLKTRLNLQLSILIALAYTINTLGYAATSSSLDVPFSQLFVIAIYCWWLHHNVRTHDLLAI